MAKDQPIDKVVQYSIAGLALFVFTNLGRQGKFGRDVQEALAALWDGLSLGDGGSGGTGGGGGGGTSGQDCPFIAGYRFITDMGDGTYKIFWNGKTVSGDFTSKAGAESAYIRLCEVYGPNGQLP